MPASVSSRGASPSGGSAAGAARSKRKRSPPSSRSSSAGSSSSGSGSESEAPRRPRSPAAVRRRSPAPVGAAASTALVPAAAAADGASTARTEEKGAELRSQLAKLTATRAGGAYIPPARLRALMAEAAAADAGSAEYQRMSWDALKKSITGLVNKVAMDNIKFIVPELFAGANLIRGRGLFCRSIMKAQMLSLVFTPTFAALASVVNTKLPMVGELLVTRLVSQFRRSFKRNDKPVCHATAMFLAHLVNQRVVHEVLALEVLVLLLEKPTDDAVEVAVSFMREVGAFLAEESPKASNSIFDRFRAVLYEGDISKRVQYMIEVLSQVRQQKFKDNPRIPEALDLVEEEDQITHRIGLDDELNVQEGLNLFKPDADFQANERKYAEIKAEILGENSDSSSGGSASGSGSGSESDDESEGEAQQKAEVAQLEIKDKTETNMVNLRRTIYLTIMSSAAFEEAVHKLLKLQIPEGQEIELCNMIIECCSQERTYSKFYGHIGVRLCKLDRLWSGCFEQCFRNYYDSIHRYETNRLRNIARFFGAVIAADGISWSCFEIVHMTEDDTTSSSRIFIKILFQEMLEKIGQKILVERFKEPSMQPAFANIFPRANPKDTRFSINYFTSIGLGPLTEEMRAYLKDVPRILAQQAALAKAQRAQESSDDSSELSSSDESSSLSSSSGDSRSPPPRRRRRYSSDSDSRSPAPRRRARSDSRSPPPPPRRRADSRADSRSPPPRRRYDDSRSRSRSPPPRRRDDSRSPPPSRRRYDSRSPPPKRRHADSRSRSPPPQRRRYDSRSPPPPVRRAAAREDSRSPVPRRRVESRSPVPRRRDDSPPRRRDDSPPRRGGGYDERGAPPHMRSGAGGGYGNGRDAGGLGGYGGAGGYGAPRGDDRPPRGLPPRDNGYARRA